MGDLLEKIGQAVESFAWSHPRTVGIVAAFLVVGSTVSSVLRAVWRDQERRPAWVRGVLAALDPFIGNFWTILAWLLEKVGIKIRKPDELSASLRAAMKEEQP